jgi:hypothetical protein
MNVIQNLIEHLDHPQAHVTHVCTGAFWTSVTSVHTALATTYRESDQQHTDKPSMVNRAGSLIGLTVKDLATYALSDNTVAASIGMAAINSALEVDAFGCTQQNASEVVAARAQGANVAVIGHFPFARRLEPVAKNLWIIERKKRFGVLPESAAEDLLPRCDVVCMSGTTLINHTFEHLMELCRHAYVVLTGPTSPLTPLLFDYGVNVISGCRVTDARHVNTFITQGATFRQLKHHGVRLYSMFSD